MTAVCVLILLVENAIFCMLVLNLLLIKFYSTRLADPVWILNDLLNDLDEKSGIDVYILYDIACLLESHLQVINEVCSLLLFCLF